MSARNVKWKKNHLVRMTKKKLKKKTRDSIRISQSQSVHAVTSAWFNDSFVIQDLQSSSTPPPAPPLLPPPRI